MFHGFERRTPRRVRARGALAIAALVAGLSGGVALGGEGGGLSDLLDRPAAASVRANKSVLLAVTRAGDRLVAVGELGIILLSDDNGANWRQAKVPTSVALTNVRFLSARQGWAVGHGGIVLHSGDGGETWRKQFDGKQAAAVELAAAQAGAGGDAGSKRLRDAERLVAEGADKPFLDIRFADERCGFVVGAYGLIYATSDGGQTWQSLKGRLDNPKGRHLYALDVAGSDIVVAGEQGALYRSRDGGATFAEAKTPYVGSYFGALRGNGPQALLVFGLRGNAYRSADDGASWQKVDLGLPVTVTAGARLADGSLALVDETGRLLQSRDGGQSFAPAKVQQPSSFTGLVQAADGSLVFSGARGITRQPLALLAEPQR